MLLSEGQMSDFKGATLMLPLMSKARELLADKGYGADWFREALLKTGGASTPIRPVRPHLLLGDLHRRSLRLLAVINES
jgi:hypothetical protein